MIPKELQRRVWEMAIECEDTYAMANSVEDMFEEIFDDHEAELKQAYTDGSNSHHKAVLGLLKRRMEAKGTTHEQRCVLQEVYESIGGK